MMLREKVNLYGGRRVRVAVRKSWKTLRRSVGQAREDCCEVYEKQKTAHRRAAIEGIVGRVDNWHLDMVPVSHETEHLDRHGNKIVVWEVVWDGDECGVDTEFTDGGLAMADLLSRTPSAEDPAKCERLKEEANAAIKQHVNYELRDNPRVRRQFHAPMMAICHGTWIVTESPDIGARWRAEAIECVAQAYLAIEKLNPEEAKQDG